MRLQTSEGLKAFREAQKAQEKGEGGTDEAAAGGGDDEWATEWKTGPGKKRKRHADGVLKGVVKRRTSETVKVVEEKETPKVSVKEAAKETKTSPPATVKPALGLGDYDSDSDD